MQEVSSNITCIIQSTNKDESQMELKENLGWQQTNFRYLSTPEKRQRYSNVRAEMEANKRKVEQVKAKVTQLAKRDGIIIDEEV